MTSPPYDPQYEIAPNSRWQNVDDDDYQGGFKVKWKYNNDNKQEIINVNCKFCKKIYAYDAKNLFTNITYHRKKCLNNGSLNEYKYIDLNVVDNIVDNIDVEMIPSITPTSSTTTLALILQPQQELIGNIDLLFKLKDDILKLDDNDLIVDINNQLCLIITKITKKRTVGDISDNNGMNSNDNIHSATKKARKTVNTNKIINNNYTSWPNNVGNEQTIHTNNSINDGQPITIIDGDHKILSNDTTTGLINDLGNNSRDHENVAKFLLEILNGNSNENHTTTTTSANNTKINDSIGLA